MTTTAARVDVDWSYRGLQTVILSNEHLTVVVLPELGGKVWEIHDRLSGRQFLWHNPRVKARTVPFGSTYDDVFFGGWDELFPNDLAEVIGDETYPDHGEVWSVPWDWTMIDDGTGAACVRLSHQTPISSCSLVKTLTLEPGARSLRVDESVTNNGTQDLPFLWKQHLAVDVSDPARIDVPARQMRLDDFGSPRAGTAGTVYPWPHLTDDTGTHDMRPTLPITSRVAEFQQSTDLDAGWCALTYTDGSGIALAFDAEVFRSCWLFASYGGWRTLQVAILEPCTGYPLSVVEGVDAGTHQVLAAGQRLNTTLRLVVYDGLAGVTNIDNHGTVTGEPL